MQLNTSLLVNVTLEAGAQCVGKVGLATEPFQPLFLFGLDPLLYGFMASFGLGILVSLLTQPLASKHVDRYFLADAGQERPVGQPL